MSVGNVAWKLTCGLNRVCDALASFCAAPLMVKSLKSLALYAALMARFVVAKSCMDVQSDFEGALVPLRQLDRELSSSERLQVGRDGLKAFELPRVSALCLKQLLVQALAHC